MFELYEEWASACGVGLPGCFQQATHVAAASKGDLHACGPCMNALEGTRPALSFVPLAELA